MKPNRPYNSIKRKKIKLHKKSKSKKLKWKKIIISLFVLGGVGVIFLSLVIAWITKDLPKPGELVNREVPKSTKIYDRTGTVLLYEIFANKKRTPVKLSELPSYVKWATITAEDRNFYSHPGFRITSILRAFITNIINRKKVQGGSTITQQLVKNVFLTPEKSYIRKIKEILLSWKIEKKFTKDQILELYLNEIPYGSTAYGIESAAQAFFGKKAKELTIAESALLASLPKAPTYYSPYGNQKDELIKRQRFIIRSMEEQGYITKKEADEALKEKLNFKPFANIIKAPHFVFYIKNILEKKYGIQTVEKGGLKVITTLDMYKQEIAEDVIKTRGEINEKKFDTKNAALIAIDPKTGEILSMVGSRDFFNKEIDGEVNVVTQLRQPGSSFKPIVYAAAFMKGLSPDTVMFDLNTVFKTVVGDYEPKNYNLKENGPVTIRQALGSSLNIPAVKTIYLTGIEDVLNLAEKMGYSSFGDRSRFGLSLVLGGAEVRLIEHVYAYAVFAREGIYRKPKAILRIEDSEGNILEKYDKPSKGEQVLDTQTARMINDILTDNEARLLTFNVNNYLNLGERPVAAKTGTTNDYRDAWTIGYTPSIVVGVWTGNNDFSPMKLKASGGSVAAPIWNEFMKKVLGDTPIEEFKKPDPIVKPNKPMLNGKYILEKKVKIDTMSGKLATDYTPKRTTRELTYAEVHNILHYVNKNNIIGPVPEKPWDDENYTTWEIPVEKWAKDNNYVLEKPPTEFDDIHKKELKPKLNLYTPKNSDVISTNTLDIRISANAPRGISEIEYYIDDKLIKRTNSSSSELVNYQNTIFIPQNILNGTHKLSVIVYDDLYNFDQKDIIIDIQIPGNRNNNLINFISPKNNSLVESSFDLELKISDNEKISKIDIYTFNTLTGSTNLIHSIQNPENIFSKNLQTNLSTGNYDLYTIVYTKDGGLYKDSSVNININ